MLPQDAKPRAHQRCEGEPNAYLQANGPVGNAADGTGDRKGCQR